MIVIVLSIVYVSAFMAIRNALGIIWKRRVLNMVRDREVTCIQIQDEFGGLIHYSRVATILKALAHDGELYQTTPPNQQPAYRKRIPAPSVRR